MDLNYSSVRCGPVEIAFFDVGPPDADDVVLLLHDGAFGSSAKLAWEGVLPLLENGVRVLAPDLLGYGSSSKVCFFGRSPQVAHGDVMVDFCASLEIRAPRVHLVGSSFGGSVAVTAVRRNHGRPWTTAMSIGGSLGHGRNVEAFNELQRYDQSPDDAKRITSLLVDDVETWPKHVDERHANGLLPGHWEALSAGRVRAPLHETVTGQPSLEETLGNCQAPILFVEGEGDRLLQRGWAAQLAAMAPRGESLRIVGAHCPNIDHPDVVASAILDFIQHTGDGEK